MLCEYGCGKEAIHQLKNGKWICSDSPNKCPSLKKKNSSRQKITHKFIDPKNNPANMKHICPYCNKEWALSGLTRHIKSCYLNPKNLKLCPICDIPIKDYKNNTTCSSKCARIYFEDKYLEYAKMAWSDKEKTYREICFEYHKKECIICGENIIVAVHHYDHNPNNNKPENLIPLCPTHHIYIHSNSMYLIKECVDEYQSNFKNK